MTPLARAVGATSPRRGEVKVQRAGGEPHLRRGSKARPTARRQDRAARKDAETAPRRATSPISGQAQDAPHRRRGEQARSGRRNGRRAWLQAGGRRKDG